MDTGPVDNVSTHRVLRGKAQAKAVEQGKLVETVNSLPVAEFYRRHSPTTPLTPIEDCPTLELILTDASNIGSHLMGACLGLVEQTSADDYRAGPGWSVSKKKKEMELPEMKYLVLCTKATAVDKSDPDVMVAGFLSFMVTYEDGHEVLYIYEIHLHPEWQAKGLGKKLMDMAELIGSNVGLYKSMLTVFLSNKRAVKWYQKLGYTEDEFSPSPRRLRNGTVKQPSYIILSKLLSRGGR